jgi:hypothetical protein
VKGSVSAPHHYLARTWEVVTPEKAADDVAKGGRSATTGAPLARIATDEECAKNGWGKQPGQAVVVFSPPHSATRFAAYKSLDEGVDAYVAYQQKKVVASHPEYLDALNAGDTKGAAHALNAAHYYTGVETDYSRGMAKKKAEIDAQIGPGTS